MLIIRDDQIDHHHFSDKFISLYHINYFINDDKRKLTAEYICYIFYTFEN